MSSARYWKPCWQNGPTRPEAAGLRRATRHECRRHSCRWTLTTTWRVETPAPYISERLFAPFAHVFDADGGRVLIVDGEAVPGYEWRAGDLHLHQMTFTLPEDAPGPFTVRVGQYDALHDENVIFILPGGEHTPLVELLEGLAE